jgi:site-specific DNA-methyltransferase (adenine-specific)
MTDSYTTLYNPDVLSTLANLSSDEVFTPPHIVNQMLDLLPQELFRNKKTTFLDPATKSGVFLREIAKRLLVGLEKEIPNLQERIDHIFHNQLYGIAITEMTSLLSRRSVYCSKYPNSKYSISLFDNPEGNIKYKKTTHFWNGEKCIDCGANKNEFNKPDLENHAYEFIHSNLKEYEKMKFDVIIGNPPYQLNVGVQQEKYAVPIYQKFVSSALRLKPRFISMIIPSRWFAGGRGLDEFRAQMLNDKSLKIIHDFIDASECFPGVEIKGGVCYFLWQRDYKGECEITSHKDGKIDTTTRPLLEEGLDTFIRHNEAIPILKKVLRKTKSSFSKLVSPQTPFGIISSFKDYSEKPINQGLKFYSSGKTGYIEKNKVIKGLDLVGKHKIFISKAYGAGEGYPHQIINKPFIVEPNSCCSQTYLVIGPFESTEQAQSAKSYIETKFFRFMVMLKKNSQDAMRGVYEFVPLMDFDKTYDDKYLYSFFNLNDSEIKLIESMIRLMGNEEELTESSEGE